MAKKSVPAAVITIAVLHFVGGGLSCCAETVTIGFQSFGGFTGMMKAFGASGTPGAIEVERLEKFQNQELPSYTYFVFGSTGLGMIVSAMLIISGIGLLKLQPWGRTLSIIYAPCAILLRLCGMGYVWAIYNPMIMRYYDSQALLPPEVISGQKVQLYLNSMIPLVFIVYPVVVLFVLTRPNVVAAFSQEEDGGGPLDSSFRAQ